MDLQREKKKKEKEEVGDIGEGEKRRRKRYRRENPPAAVRHGLTRLLAVADCR